MNRFLPKIETSLIRQMNSKAKPSTVNLGLGQVVMEPDTRVTAQVQLAAFNSENYQYTPTSGSLELRQLIADRYSERAGIEYNADNILVTAGATQGITMAFIAMLGKDRNRVLAPEISYPTYTTVPRILGALSHPIMGNEEYEVETFKLNRDFSPNLEDLTRKLDSKTILVLNSPSNPCGNITPPKTLEKIADRAGDKGALVFSDEVYSEFYFDGETKPTPIDYYISDGRNLVVFDSLSKAGRLAGLRVGWVIAEDSKIEQITKAHQWLNSCVNSIAQKAAVTVLRNPQIIKETRDKVKENRDMLVSFLESEGVRVCAEGALYAFFDISYLSHYGKSVKVANTLLEERDVLTIPGRAFGEAGDSYLRLSFGAKREELEKGITRMEGFFRK